MTLRAFIICLFGIFHKGVTALVQTQPETTGLAGEQVSLYCQLTEPKDVHQVTWQKISPDGETNVATFKKGVLLVFTEFQGKVKFKDAGLQNSSIVILKVTDQDEGCYRCLFNAKPDGVLTGKTCLQVHKLFGPFLHLRESNWTEEVIVSCSATGRPAPTVTITAPQTDLLMSHNESVSFTNEDRTVTVNKTAVLSRLHNNSIKVSCAAQVLSVPQKEVFKMIPEVKPQPTAGGKALIIAVSVLLIFACVPALIFLHIRLKKHNSALHSDFEENELNLESIRNPHKTEATTNFWQASRTQHKSISPRTRRLSL
ncbi:OX-2 membrane glycoprotein-like [Halichoeres trimaculatus]|uniref:OX-2 membrane glycoprotein-like n=1 Tax=Halichoeres trimaculatus TaxID=147232 RepID=UPI003D9E6862